MLVINAWVRINVKHLMQRGHRVLAVGEDMHYSIEESVGRTLDKALGSGLDNTRGVTYCCEKTGTFLLLTIPDAAVFTGTIKSELS